MAKLTDYLQYLWRSKSKHGVHSPFVFDFVTKVLPHRLSAMGARIDALRLECMHDSSLLAIEDFGAGYGGNAAPHIQKSVREVTRSSARGRREGELLARICTHYAPQQVLELGTNLGFASLYMSTAIAADAQLVTVEGSTELAAMAGKHFGQFALRPVQIVAEFEQALRHEIDWAAFAPNLVLLDGNHRKQATLDYVDFLLPRVAQGAILILDDIYWSAEMAEAWRQIIQHPRVTVSIDLFALGICFLDRPQAQEQFTLRFRAW
jgi:predicted O-methyltransferase YrrM